MTLIADNPCPKCGARCHLMAGINVPKGQTDTAYLVCWGCNMRKATALNAQWEAMGKPLKQPKKAKEDESMGAIFQGWKSAKQRRKAQNLAAVDPTGWHKHTDYHWSRIVAGKKLDYWPSTRKWMYEGRVMHGDLDGFIRKREA